MTATQLRKHLSNAHELHDWAKRHLDAELIKHTNHCITILEKRIETMEEE